MERLATQRNIFKQRLLCFAFDPLPAIRDEGLVLGHGTVLMRMSYKRSGEEQLRVSADEARLLALLSAVYGRQVSPRIMHHIARASEQSTRGDEVLTHIELAFARLPRLESQDDAFRLFLAEDLLESGMTPRALARALGFDPALLKYDPNEARNPKGSGRPSGRWVRVDVGGTQQTPSFSAFVTGTVAAAADSVLASSAPQIAGWLAAFAANTAGVTAFVGFLVIPTPNSGGVYEGAVPDAPGVHYRFSEPTGELEVVATADDGTTVTLHAHRRDNEGAYYDASGRPLGRDVGTGLYVNLDAVDAGLRAELGAPEREEPDSQSFVAFLPDEPRLCPNPSQDQGKPKDPPILPRDERDFDELYQEYIGSIINPQIQPPLPAALGYALFNPASGKAVVFDHCQLTSVIMVEAKGHYEGVLKYAVIRRSLTDEFLKQAASQIQAADANGDREIEWHFYEEATMEYAREIFANKGDLGRIRLIYTPYPGDDEWPYPKEARRRWARGRQKQ